jgi:nucleotide-sensitive chloride channel 1A
MSINLSAMNAPTEGIRHKQTEIAAFVNENEFGVGTLYISESVVTWISNDGRGFSLPYPTISMHAISRDGRSFHMPCIYMVLDLPSEKNMGETNVNERNFSEKLAAACSLQGGTSETSTSMKSGSDTVGATNDNGDHNGSGDHQNEEHEDNDDDEQGTAIVEVRFAPNDVASLEPMYQALSECQALHPDENESFSEDEDGEQAQFGGASDEFQFDEHGQLVVGRQMRGVQDPDNDAMEDEHEVHHVSDDDMETGQFDDAE